MISPGPGLTHSGQARPALDVNLQQRDLFVKSALRVNWSVLIDCLGFVWLQASFALKVGELCQDVVETDSGFHAILRIG